MTDRPEEPRISDFERELFARLSPFEQFQVMTLLEVRIADGERDALAEVREYQRRAHRGK